MKKWIMSSCMGAVLALTVGAVSTAYGSNQGGAAAFCALFEEQTGLPQDVCVACFNPGSGDKALCLCKGLEDAGIITGPLGECVSYIQQHGIQ